MRDTVAIQLNTPTPSLYGENVDSWATVDTVYAEVEQVSAAERLIAGQPVGTTAFRIRVRRRDDAWDYVSGAPFYFVSGVRARFVRGRAQLRPGVRLVYRGRNLEVLSAVDEGERHRFTLATAVEVM
jgi:head-tail adaptor